MNVLVVDDEPLAANLIEMYLQKLPGFSIAGKCSNAVEAFALLGKHNIDVVFLDIKMPEITGMDLLKMLKDPPNIIFTTAYTHYAAESYNYNVIDYLVKPITFERFMKAIHKLQKQAIAGNAATTQDNETLFVRSDGKLLRIILHNLLFIEGYKNYVRLWTTDGKILVHNTMKHFEEHLQRHNGFIRIHKSYIINIAYIQECTVNYVRTGNENLPIGAIYRDNLEQMLKRFKQV